MRTMKINVAFDMRSPEWATPTNALYASAVKMAAFADQIGVDQIGLMEHHGSDDGYLPQPFVLAAAMAAVTTNVRFALGAVILPLHDPVMIAEKIAIADQISNGRIRVTLAAGYVPYEFDLFGKSLKDRARLMDTGLEIILRGLKGERFEIDGRPVFIRPLPVQRPEDIVLVGGGVPATAKRAARLGLGLGPMTAKIIPIYEEECRALGREPGFVAAPKPGAPFAIHLCEDPEEGWAAIERHALHVVVEYAKWAEQEGENSNSPFKALTNVEALKRSGMFAAWTPDQLIERASSLEDGTTLTFQPLVGGLAPEQGWKSLKLLEQTLPRLKQALAALPKDKEPAAA